MIGAVKEKYLQMLAVYAYVYALIVVLAWIGGIYGIIATPPSLLAVILVGCPVVYYLFLFNFTTHQFGRRIAYTVGVGLIVLPMIVVSLATAGHISANTLALALLIFLSATLGPGVPLALIWMMAVGYVLSLAGYIPALQDAEIGTLILAIYVTSGLVGWMVFKRFYIREDPALEKLRSTLRVEQLKSEGVIAAISDGVALVNRDGIVVHANERFMEMIALKSHEIIGRNYSEVMSSRLKIVASSSATPRIGKNIMHVMETGEPITIDLVSFEYADGSGTADVTITISPLKNDNNEISAVMIMGRDITSLMRLQRMKDALIQTASHELRTPITVIAGYADLLLGNAGGGELTEKQRHYIQRTKDTTVQLTHMINDMLDMSRLESGQNNNNPVDFNILRRLEKVTESRISQFTTKSLTLHLDALPIRVHADPSQVEQVMANLLSNAFKFTPEHGKVTVTAKEKDTMCEITISDTGPGIPDAHLDDIFDKFIKLDDTGSLPGAGLGLSIAKNIVSNWGGTITATNNPEGGARFYFTVPLATNNEIKEDENGQKNNDR